MAQLRNTSENKKVVENAFYEVLSSRNSILNMERTKYLKEAKKSNPKNALLKAVNSYYAKKLSGSDSLFVYKNQFDIKKSLYYYHNSFGKQNLKITKLIQEGQHVCITWKASGDHKGGFLGIQGHNHIGKHNCDKLSMTVSSLCKVVNGEIKSFNQCWDRLLAFEKLGRCLISRNPL